MAVTASATIQAAVAGAVFTNLVTDPSAEGSAILWTTSKNTVTNLVPNPSAEAGSSLPGWAAAVPTRTNLVTNPSVETDLSGWTLNEPTQLNANPDFVTDTSGYSTTDANYLGSSGATLTREATDDTKNGTTRGKVVTTAASASQGIATSSVGAGSSGQTFTVSVWLKGAVGGETVRVGIGRDNTAQFVFTDFTLTAGWAQYTKSLTLNASATTIQAVVHDRATVAETFYVSRFIVRQAASVSTAGVTHDNTWSSAGSFSARLAATIVGSDAVSLDTPSFAVTAGQTYGAGIFYKATTMATGSVQILIRWSDGTTSLLGTISATGSGRITGTVTAPVGVTSATIRAAPQSADTYDVSFDGALAAQSSTALPYFDGDTPGYGWTGVPHASTSSNTATVTNLISNPSFETDTIGATPTGWTPGAAPAALSAAVTVQTAGAYIGTQGMRWVTTTNGQGATVSLPGTFKAGVTYTVTLRAKGAAGGENFTIDFRDTPSADNARVSPTLTTSWTEYRLSWTPSADRTTVVLSIYAAQTANWTWYVDAIGVFASTNNAGYFDGTFPGASWTGTAHASTSTRSAAGVVQNLVTNGDFEVNTTGWATSDASWLGSAGATLTRDTGTKRSGAASGKVVTTSASLQQGIVHKPAAVVPSGVSVTFSVWIKGNAGGELIRIVAGADDTSHGYTVLTNQTLTTGWTQFILQFTTTATTANWAVAVMSEGSVARTFFVDDVELIYGKNPSAGASGSQMTAFTGATTGAWWMGAGSSTLSNSVLPALTQSSDWAASGSKSFRFCANALASAEVFSVTSPTMSVTQALSYAASLAGNVSVIGATATVRVHWSTGATSTIQAISATGTAAWSTTATAPTGATSAYIEFVTTSAGLADLYFDSVLFMQASVVPAYFDGDSLGYNWTGQPHLSRSVNVSLGAVTNLCTNPGFQTGSTGWAGVNATVAQDSNFGLYGNGSLKVTVTATGGADAYFNVTGLTSGQTYTLSYWVFSPTGDTFRAQSDVGNGSFIAAPARTWSQRTYTFTANSTSTNIYAYRQDDGTTGAVFWVDGVTLTQTSTAPDFFDGDTPGAVWNGTRGASTSTSYQGAVLNLVQDPSLETGTTGWSGASDGTFLTNTSTISQSAAQAYVGSNSLQVISASSGFVGARYNLTGFFKTGVTYAATVRVYGPTGLYALQLAGPTDARSISTVTLATNTWTEIRTTWVPTSDQTSAQLTVYVPTSITCYVDAAGVFQGSGWTGGVAGKDSGYFDGAMSNASWVGTTHASPSLRDPGGLVNLMPNGGFESDTVGASPAGNSSNGLTTFLVQSGWAATGTKSLRITAGGGGGLVDFGSPSWGGGKLITTIVPGRTYSASLRLNKLVHSGSAITATVYWYNSSGGYFGSSTSIGSSAAGTGLVTLSATNLVAPANATQALVELSAPANVDLYVDSVIFYEGNALPAYFDGSATGAFWGGAAGNSYSILPPLTVSTNWAASGTKSLRTAFYTADGSHPTPVLEIPLSPNTTYSARISYNGAAAPGSGYGVVATITERNSGHADLGTNQIVNINTISSGTATVTFTTGSSTAYGAIYFTTNGGTGLHDVSFDAVLVALGSVAPAYFDGSSYQAQWNGAANASTSTKIIWNTNGLEQTTIRRAP